MIEIGRLCVKIAGRDAGLKCVVVDVLGKNIVLIDGETRRRKCNIAHLEPLAQKLPLEKGASHEKVVAAFKEIGVSIVERKPKATSKPKPADPSAAGRAQNSASCWGIAGGGSTRAGARSAARRGGALTAWASSSAPGR